MPLADHPGNSMLEETCRGGARRPVDLRGAGRAAHRGSGRGVAGRAALGLLAALAASAPAVAVRADEARGGAVSPPGEHARIAIAAGGLDEEAPASSSLGRPWPTPLGTRPDPLHRNLMWVTGGLTLAGIALGSTFGGLAITTWNEVERTAGTSCSSPARYQGCARPVPQLARRAMSYATISDFSFIAAGAALAGTTVLWLTVPPDSPGAGPRVQIVPGVLGGSVVGVF
jgi:hypothetical protein